MLCIIICLFVGLQETNQQYKVLNRSLILQNHPFTKCLTGFLLSLAPTIITMPKSNLEKESMANEFKNVSELICIANKKFNIADLRTP